MSITRFHVGIWRQDLKIIGKALSHYIRGKFSGMVCKIRNIEIPFPLHGNVQKKPSSTPILHSKPICGEEGTPNKNVVLRSYTKFTLS